MKLVRTSALAVAIVASVTLVSAATPPAFGEAGGSSSASPEDAAIDNVLSATSNDALVQTMAELERMSVVGVHAKYGDLVAQTAALDASTLEVRYWRGHELAGALEELLQEADGTLPMDLVAVPVDFDPKAVDSLAQKLSVNDPAVLRQAGLSTVESVSVDTATGDLTVFTSTSPRSNRVSIDGVEVRVESGVETEFQSRGDDGAPWSGGIVGRGSATLGLTPDCTFGFNWRKWNGELMGSTAEHCFELGGISNWYNYGTLVGSRYYYSSARDATLIRSAGGSGRFNPNVFVGTQNTNTLRWVTQVMPKEPVGTAVALSGGASGLNVGSILSTTFYLGGKGPFRETSMSSCLGGDSGGPWLTTLSGSGDVVAHGQHGGVRIYSGSLRRCFYMPVTPISAALGASIYTY